MSNPVDTLIPDTGKIAKGDLQTAFKKSGHAMTLAEARGATLIGYEYIFVTDLAKFFVYSSTSTAVDDGYNTIVSADSQRFLAQYELHPFMNVLPDSRKLCVQPSTFSATAFKTPTFLTVFNGAAFSDGGTFIHNNADFGGTSGSMNSQVVDLMNKLKTSDEARKFGLVFRLANISAITGTVAPLTFDSETWYLNCISTLGSQIVPKSTTRILIRALVDDFIIIKTNSNNRIFVDGVEQSPAGSGSHVRITPAMGWVNVVILNDNANDLSNSSGYSPEWFKTYAKPTTQIVFAGPALSIGHCHVPVGQTFLPSASNWS